MCELRRVPGTGEGDILVVFPRPASPKIRKGIAEHLKALPPYRLTWAIKCGEDCTDHYEEVRAEMERYRWVLSLGAESWKATANKGNITKYRGRLHNDKIFPTINPSATFLNPGLLPGFQADIRNFVRLVDGDGSIPFHTPRDVRTVTPDSVKEFCADLRLAVESSFDIETIGDAEFLPDAAIVSLATTLLFEREDLSTAVVWRLPLYHPESQFRDSWREVLVSLAADLCAPPSQVAHNGKYDCKWLHYFDVPIRLTFDTIMAVAVLEENERKSLKTTAERVLGAEPWGVDTRKLLDMPLDEVLDYNGLDTWHTLRLKIHYKRELLKQPLVWKRFTRIVMPLVRELIEVEKHGVYVDPQRLAAAKDEVDHQLVEIEMALMAQVPDKEHWPATIKNLNFNASNFARWWLFEWLGFPVLAKGKTGPSMSQHLLSAMAEGDNVPALLVRRTKLVKLRNGFYTPWTDQLKLDSRLHTTFKPWGTVTGRLSSGKEGDDK